MSVFFKCFLFFFFAISTCEEDNIENNKFCSKEDSVCSQENVQSDSIKEHVGKADPYYNQVLSHISASVSKYKECESNNCSCFFQTLIEDLKPFKNGITKSMINNVRSKGVTYLIYNHKLYRDKDCLFPARCSGNEHFLLPLVKKLDNMELIVNVRDWPQTSRNFNIFGPVLSFSKTADNYDIMYPAWSFWEGGPAIRLYPTGLGRWDLHMKSLKKESEKYPWEKKKPIGFFRGSRTSEKRDPLILLSRKRPDLLDAQYTKNQAWKSSSDTLGAEPAKEVSLEYHCQYKYLFNFRGVAASFRFKHLFLCGSLVIHVGSEWQEFFYSALEPWVHYIPLKDNANEDEIAKLLMFLQNHDDVVKDIAARGQAFIMNHLSLKEVKCYWRNLLKRYKKLMKYNVEFNDNLIEIK